MKLRRITTEVTTGITTYIKVKAKAGFSKEGFHKKILPVRGEWLDNYEYAILEENDFKINHEQE